MVRTALRIYKKNIWEIFALMGFVSIGIFVGLFIIIPQLTSLVNSTYDRVVTAAKSVSLENFDANAFMNSLTEQFGKLDWANPINTLRELFNPENANNLEAIIVNALNAANLGPAQIALIMNDITAAINDLSAGIAGQWAIFLSCMGTSSVIGYLLTKLVIYVRSTTNKGVIKFILTFILNSLSFALAFYLMDLCTKSLTGASKFLALIGVFMVLLVLTFTVAMLFYKPKDVSRKEVFNWKTTFGLLLAGFVIFMVSYGLIALIYVFSDIIAIILTLPVLIITSIILENIVIAYVSDYKNIKNNSRKSRRNKKKAELAEAK